MSKGNNYINFITTNLTIDAQVALAFLEGDVPVSVRINPNKNIAPPSTQGVPWCNNGYYLPQRPQFTFDPHFHQGRYYVQEASSMYISYLIHALKLNEKPLAVLDACAAPGGKSSLLVDCLHTNSVIVSNEVIASRVGSLQYNMGKWGNINGIITQSSIENFGETGELFDLILLDAPCSGEGMFRKDKGALQYWSTDAVNLNASRQKKLLSDAWQSLKTGGYLIYSTCTYNTLENEENIAWAIENLLAENISIKNEHDVFPSKQKNIEAHRFYAGQCRGEGFTVAVLRKNNSARLTTAARRNKTSRYLPVAYHEPFLLNHELYKYRMIGNNLHAMPVQVDAMLGKLEAQVKIIECGCKIGATQMRKFMPELSLALSTQFNQETFRKVELSLDNALIYLRGGTNLPAIEINETFLYYYDDLPLGFAKKIGNRINNYYPPYARIRMK